MKPKQIKSLDELLLFMPALLELHKNLAGKIDPDYTSIGFCSRLIRFFDTSFYFIEMENGEIKYFASILPEDGDRRDIAVFWCLYVNPKNWDLHSELIDYISLFLKEREYKAWRAITTHLTTSYERRANKNNAFKKFITYERTL